MDGGDFNVEKISHNEAMKEIHRLLSDLTSDPFLDNLPPHASVEDAASVLAVEQCKAITVHLRKLDGAIVRT